MNSKREEALLRSGAPTMCQRGGRVVLLRRIAQWNPRRVTSIQWAPHRPSASRRVQAIPGKSRFGQNFFSAFLVSRQTLSDGPGRLRSRKFNASAAISGQNRVFFKTARFNIKHLRQHKPDTCPVLCNLLKKTARTTNPTTSNQIRPMNPKTSHSIRRVNHSGLEL
jgi:hypothetical protein